MRMHGKTRNVVFGIVGAEMIEKEKWIKVIETSGCDYPAKLHACAVGCWFRLYDALNFSWCAHINILARRGRADGRVLPGMPWLNFYYGARVKKTVFPSWNRRGGRAVKKYRRRHPLIGTDGVVSPE